MVARGLRRRCARCGSKGIFESWFKLRQRCPRCGYRFEREEGFFTGVYLVNYAAVAVVLVIELFAFILYDDANGGQVSFVPMLAVAVATAIVLPLLTYPFAKALWAAIDLAARPLEPDEEAEALLNEHDIS
jgi:uncharacterized protein (DUF983 family)